MKQLKINITLYNKKQGLFKKTTYSTTYWGDLAPSIIESALKVLRKATPKELYYVITDIVLEDVTEESVLKEMEKQPVKK